MKAGNGVRVRKRKTEDGEEQTDREDGGLAADSLGLDELSTPEGNLADSEGPGSSGREGISGGGNAELETGAGADSGGVEGSEKQGRSVGSKKLSKEKLEKLNEKYRKRGVVYLSRIPPHLKPLKLRHMLEPFGEVLRIYLAPEDSAIRMRRKRAGGDSGKNFTEGWVEFAKKGVAKRVAEMLNGQPMGGPRRSAYHYDLWNLKYLHKFKWDNLTEEIAYRNAVREQRLAAEISSAKRERDFYLSKVDQSRAFSAMDERRKKRKTQGTSEGIPSEDKVVPSAGEGTVKVRRRFPQRTAVATFEKESRPVLPNSILSKVFGSTS